MNAEDNRLRQDENRTQYWKRWGPYLSERAWGTVREDYSAGGTAWDYFPHDHARSRAYRWNEDGLAGICDRHQRICLALAFWNERDPILKERLFGLSGPEGNHGEDVKEYYFYLDSTPTHSYMRWLYKYPQAEFPYAELLRVNAERGRTAREYELVDTGIFDRHAYFDIEAEYAKIDPEDLLLRITIHNRGAAGGADSLPAHDLVPQPVDLEDESATAATPPGACDRMAPRWWRSRIPSTASAGCTAISRRRFSSPRTKPTPSGCTASARLAISRTASTTRW